MGHIETLAASLLFLIGSHALPSAPRVRGRAIALLGRPWFYVLYSLLSTAALAAVILSYRAADPGLWIWVPPAGAPAAAVLAMPLALFLLVGRLTTPPDRHRPRGIYRICCAPGSLAVLLWASLHLANVGAARTVLLFAAMVAIALVALVKNAAGASPEQKRAGVLPFSGILRGQERCVWPEIGWARVLAAGLLYAVLIGLHPLVIGPDPLAWLL